MLGLGLELKRQLFESIRRARTWRLEKPRNLKPWNWLCNRFAVRGSTLQGTRVRNLLRLSNSNPEDYQHIRWFSGFNWIRTFRSDGQAKLIFRNTLLQQLRAGIQQIVFLGLRELWNWYCPGANQWWFLKATVLCPCRFLCLCEAIQKYLFQFLVRCQCRCRSLTSQCDRFPNLFEQWYFSHPQTWWEMPRWHLSWDSTKLAATETCHLWISRP